jgi:hypothetical protein
VRDAIIIFGGFNSYDGHCLIVPIHLDIMDLSYSAIQRFFEVTSSWLGPAAPAPAAGQTLNVEVTPVINKTEHNLANTMGSYFGEQGGGEGMVMGFRHPTTEGPSWVICDGDLLGLWISADSRLG